MENSGDKYASLILPHYQPTASQEEKLRSCPFARESEFPSDGNQSSSSSEHATQIIMVSLSESSGDYHTPPEQHYDSLNSSDDDQVPATKRTAICRDTKSGRAGDRVVITLDDDDDDKKPLGQPMVDLANDSNNLGLKGTVREINAEKLVCETADTELVSSVDETANQVFVEMPKRATVVNTNLNTGKRKVPFSVTLDRVWKLLKHGKDEIEEDSDFLEVAKSRGLTFPTPRW